MTNVAFDGHPDFNLLRSRQWIERELKAILSSQAEAELISEAVRYSVLGGGKLFRPLLSLAFYQDIGGLESDHYLKIACSIELLHAASLIHDDLPALDNDEIRRGKQTCHVAFNEATAILAGDYLVALAHKVVSRAAFKSDSILKVTEKLADTYMQLCCGQQIDLLKSASEMAERVALLKTGALFSSCFALPCLCCDASPHFMSRSEELGFALGLLFQISDDFSDYKVVEPAGRSAGKGEVVNRPIWSSEQLRSAHFNLNNIFSELEGEPNSAQSRFWRSKMVIESTLPGSIDSGSSEK